MYDIAIIGCGVIGAATAYALSHYEAKTVVLEAENDVADCTTKANSAILHAGYDPEPGTRTFRQQLAEAGFAITDHLEDDIDLLVSGFDTELTFQKLEDSCILLGRGVDWIATNPDWVCPTSYGSVPDCGSVCQMLSRATGKEPHFIGKPEPDMALLSMEKYGCTPEETVLVGDRIYTDIACGVNAGIDTAFVLSGEGVPADIEKFGVHPTETYRDIREILSHML